MSDFDLMCLWIGRIVLGGSVCFVALCTVALLVLKVVERVFGKEAMQDRERTAQQLVGVLAWHKSYIEAHKPEVSAKEDVKCSAKTVT